MGCSMFLHPSFRSLAFIPDLEKWSRIPDIGVVLIRRIMPAHGVVEEEIRHQISVTPNVLGNKSFSLNDAMYFVTIPMMLRKMKMSSRRI